MPNIINADNGVSSGSAGLKSSSDGTGVLALQTNGTTAVTVDASQNVGIGTSSPSGRLNLAVGASTSCVLRLTANNTGTGAGDRGRLDFYSADNSGTAYQLGYMDYDRSDGTGTASYIAWANRKAGTVSESMRIDSSGNLLVGTTSDPGGSARVGIKGSGTTISTVSLYIINSSSVGNFLVYDNGAINTGTTSAGSPYVNTTGNAANAVLGSDGFLRRSTSSLKYKTDIQDATHGLTDLLKLRSVTYKGKNDGDIIFGGLIAEEVDAAGLNEFVQYSADGSPDALAYGNMVSLCVKAIQEQQAIITTLTARITALEAQNADNPPQGETP